MLLCHTSLRFPFLVLVFICYSCQQPVSIEPTSLPLNNGWFFQGDELNPDTIDIPHIPRIEPLVVNDQWQGKMSYQKSITIDQPNKEKIFLHFEGVMTNSSLYVNEKFVASHQGGYLPFYSEITSYLQQGENTIKVEVSNLDDSEVPPGKPLKYLDFNTYGGIYRDVWLIRKNEIYITNANEDLNSEKSGVLVHFENIDSASAEAHIETHINNTSPYEQNVKLEVALKHEDKQIMFDTVLTVGSQIMINLPIKFKVNDPVLWSVNSPNLYDLSIQLKSNDLLLDSYTEKVGIRHIHLDSSGFYLNGEQLYIRGTNRHQEYPYVGYAISNNANYRDALKIKNAGFDFVRLSHYPQDPSFLDACDELGLLVMNAIPGWQFYADGQFASNALNDVKYMVRRDRNHPSIVFWEVSLNESEMPVLFVEKADSVLKAELPFDDTYSAGWVDYQEYDLFIPARQHASPPHYWNDYEEGKRPLFIAEYGDWEYYAHNAGFNQTAFEGLTDSERNSRQLRAAGEKRLLQQAMNFQEAANSNRKGVSTVGHANWLMFDYNRGYADDLEASGISDIFRIPKFAYFFYQSQRPPFPILDIPNVESGPMIKIASYWNDSSDLDLTIYSNCEKVVLYLNDRLIAVKSPSVNQFSDHLEYPPFQFKVDHFEPGKLLAYGVIDDEEVAVDSVNTSGEPASIQIFIDTLGGKTTEQNDLYFVYANVVDNSGNVVISSNVEIEFDLIGDGGLIGANPVKAEAGIATILAKKKNQNSSIKITAKSKGLNSSMVSY